jgi:hypothetical protein
MLTFVTKRSFCEIRQIENTLYRQEEIKYKERDYDIPSGTITQIFINYAKSTSGLPTTIVDVSDKCCNG